jgi:hypothetical protein
MEANERFNTLLNFKGYGNPNNKNSICFIGIEEALGFEEKDYNNIDKDLIHEKYKIGFEICESGQYSKDKRNFEFENKRGYTRIYEIMGKIIKSFKDLPLNKILDEHLFTNNGFAFQMNLFPLGKNNIIDRPEQYVNPIWFGLNNYEEYIETVKEKRFPILRKFWFSNKNNYMATICFGKCNWNEFRQVFDLYLKNNISENNSFECYIDEKIILSPFFRYGKYAMNNKNITIICDMIKNNFKTI